MKDKLIQFAFAAAACILALTGCKTQTTVTNWPDGTTTTESHTRLDPERTSTAIRTILPGAVRLAVLKQPEARTYIANAQLAVCAVAMSDNLSPTQLKAAVAATGIKEIQTPEAQVAIEAIYGIYQSYYGDVVAAKLNQSEWLIPVLEAICDGLGEGLTATEPQQ